MKIFICSLLILGLTMPTSFSSVSTENPPGLSGVSSVQQQIEEVLSFYEEKYALFETKTSRLFNIDYKQLIAQQQNTMRELNFKMSLLNQIEDSEERALQLESLRLAYPSEEIQKAMEAYYYFQNSIEEDHEFVGELLSKLEAILDATIQEDPLFRYIFHSNEFRAQYGLVMKRVVWQIQPGEEVSGQTVPLNVHSIFADKTKTPLLVKLTPVAFKSHAFLKSILIHELNHVLMFKDPRFSNSKVFEGKAVAPASGPFSHYFKQLSSTNPSYQFYLIHEYYSFKCQMLFDEQFADPALKLDAANQTYFRKAMAWTHDQMNGKNKSFVLENIDPSLLAWMQRFYPSSTNPQASKEGSPLL